MALREAGVGAAGRGLPARAAACAARVEAQAGHHHERMAGAGVDRDPASGPTCTESSRSRCPRRSPWPPRRARPAARQPCRRTGPRARARARRRRPGGACGTRSARCAPRRPRVRGPTRRTGSSRRPRGEPDPAARPPRPSGASAAAPAGSRALRASPGPRARRRPRESRRRWPRGALLSPGRGRRRARSAHRRPPALRRGRAFERVAGAWRASRPGQPPRSHHRQSPPAA
jgi:hypothetical protein